MAPFLRSRLEAQSPDDEFEEDDLCRSITLRLGIMDDVRFRVMEELSVTCERDTREEIRKINKSN